MASYQTLLEPLFPDTCAAGIEAYIRVEQPDIDSLSIDEFVRLGEKAIAYERACPGFLSGLLSAEAPHALAF